jgi:hypothetical protein
MEKSCLWLINHGTLASWELPLLNYSGYTQVFTPQNIPSNPVFTSGTVDEIKWKNSKFTSEDIMNLSMQDWYGKIDEKTAATANRHFEIAFVTADPTQVINVLKAFKGQVVIRLFGLDSGRTYSDLYKQSYTPHEWSYLVDNLHRIVFASGYKEILFQERDWIKTNAVYLPIGLPSKRVTEWKGDIKRLFAVVPRIEPGSYFFNLLKSHYSMAGRNEIVIGGRQHLLFKDRRILGALGDSEFYSEMLSSRAMIYASKEVSHVHYHPLEAMQSGMPVIFYRDSLLGNLLGKDLVGSVKSKRQAHRLIRQLMRNPLIAKSIGENQRDRVKGLERESLEGDFLEGIKEIERRQSKSPDKNHLRFILCSENHKNKNCASHYFKTLTAIKISERGSQAKSSGEIKLKIIEYNQNDLRKKYLDAHRYSKIFYASSDFIYELLAEEDAAEIILCGTTLPGVIVSNSSMTRFLNSSVIDEIKKEPFSSEIEKLRYSLATLDNIIVIDDDDKKTLLAFTPVLPKMVKVQNK